MIFSDCFLFFCFSLLDVEFCYWVISFRLYDWKSVSVALIAYCIMDNYNEISYVSAVIIGCCLHDRVFIAALWCNSHFFICYAISQVHKMSLGVGLFLQILYFILSCIYRFHLQVTLGTFFMLVLS